MVDLCNNLCYAAHLPQLAERLDYFPLKGVK